MVEILDCTLRDGGYYTGWDFDAGLVENYVDCMARLPVDQIELGYVNDDVAGYYGEYFFLRPDKLRAVKRRLRPEQKLVVMIDGKTGRVERIEPLFARLANIVDGVRITAAPDALDHAIDLARAIKALGFTVGLNIMYMSQWQDDLDRLKPVIAGRDAYDSLALVDSFGGCVPHKVTRAVRALRVILPEKTIGFHAHDNMCLAFANTLAAIEGGADIIDGTLTGMGRGAGNMRTEMILVHLGQGVAGQPLDYQALAAVSAPFEEMRKRYQWGTNLPYMLSGANNLPQKDVMDWLAQSRFSTVSILRALQEQSGQEKDGVDYPPVSALRLSAGAVLMIGGGQSVADHLPAIADLVRVHDPIVVFSSKRYLGYADRIGGRQLLCMAGHDLFPAGFAGARGLAAAVVAAPPRAPDIVPANLGVPVHQATPLAYPTAGAGPVSDSGPLALGLGIVEALNAAQCWLVGFDGYEQATRAQQDLTREVQGALAAFAERRGANAIVSLTPTRYAVPQRSLYGLVAAAA